MTGKLTADQKKWQAEDDARVLAEAASLRSDKARMGRAKTAAAAMVKEQEKRISGLRTVAKKAPVKKTVSKRKTLTMPKKK